MAGFDVTPRSESSRTSRSSSPLVIRLRWIWSSQTLVPAGAPLILAVRAGETGGIVEVRDGGPGFTDDDLAVAFDRGALHRRYRGVRKVGSGLGLALASGLVGRLGGEIAAGHAPEGGAAFTVRLPPDPYPTRTSA